MNREPLKPHLYSRNPNRRGGETWRAKDAFALLREDVRDRVPGKEVFVSFKFGSEMRELALGGSKVLAESSLYGQNELNRSRVRSVEFPRRPDGRRKPLFEITDSVGN